MHSTIKSSYLTSRQWHRAIVGGSGMILRHTSALEFLELFSGYLSENRIDVYAKRQGNHENINYFVVETYDGIEYETFGNVLCASINQTINDMLSDFENIDEQSLVEGLSRYYYEHGKSFDRLVIAPENVDLFDRIKKWALAYYDEE